MDPSLIPPTPAMIKGQFVIYAGYALLGLAVFILSRMLLQESETRAAQENLEESRKGSNKLVNLTKPFFRPYLVPVFRGKPFWENQRKKYRRKLISGGLRDELTPDEFIAFKAFLIVFFPLVFAILRATDLLFLEWYTILGTGVAGWFYPDFWVNGRISARQAQILKSMPFIVDLLALSTEAGLDFVGAIGKVVEKANTSPLVEEFDQLLREIKVGASRAEALREMAARIGMSQINSFVAILISADQMGASIGKILRQQSEQIRVERMLRAEKAGARAAQLVILPVVLFVIPSVLIMIFAPFGIGLLYPGGVK